MKFVLNLVLSIALVAVSVLLLIFYSIAIYSPAYNPGTYLLFSAIGFVSFYFLSYVIKYLKFSFRLTAIVFLVGGVGSFALAGMFDGKTYNTHAALAKLYKGKIEKFDEHAFKSQASVIQKGLSEGRSRDVVEMAAILAWYIDFGIYRTESESLVEDNIIIGKKKVQEAFDNPGFKLHLLEREVCYMGEFIKRAKAIGKSGLIQKMERKFANTRQAVKKHLGLKLKMNGDSCIHAPIL